ncbi:MAG: type II toxin-antitoxin system RelE/ParE family toxin [Planctomycetales bacterium]|nr:type II toxin-antitoxin system RelE/ParE family toxin [Planctomycetales bacterium]
MSPAASHDLENIVDELMAFGAPAAACRSVDELERVTVLLSDFPTTYQRTADPAIRRAVLHSCRQTLYFTIRGREVTILAVLPSMAGPEFLARRGVAN